MHGLIEEIRIDTVLLGGGIVRKYEHISGLPVTRELLLRSGGIETTRRDHQVIQMEGSPSVAVEELHDCVRVWINGIYTEFNNYYMHQLQNLVFELTRKELRSGTDWKNVTRTQCPDCEGTGVFSKDQNSEIWCVKCSATGEIVTNNFPESTAK